MTKRMWLVLLLVLGLVAAGCGDDDDGGSGDADGASVDGEASDGAGGGDAAGEPGVIDVDTILAAADADCTEPTGEEALRIGYAADFSELGGYADLPGSEAAQYMVDLINCSGGIDGTPVELVVEDVAGSEDVTQQAVQRLLDAGVSAILGPPFSDYGLPLLTVVNTAVPVVFVASTDPLLPDAAANSFLTAFDDYAQATAAAEFALEQGFTTAVTLSSPGIPYFEDNPRVFTEAFERGGGTTAADYTFSLEDADFSTQVNEIAALDPAPDVIYTAMIMPSIATFIGQLRAAGVEAAIIGPDGFDATGLVSADPEVSEGVYYTTHGFPAEGSRMKAFLDAFEAANGAPLETISFGTLAADAVLIVADAYARAGSTDPLAIADAIKVVQDLGLVTETVSFAGTNGTPVKPVFVHQIVDGAPTLAASFVPVDVVRG